MTHHAEDGSGVGSAIIAGLVLVISTASFAQIIPFSHD